MPPYNLAHGCLPLIPDQGVSLLVSLQPHRIFIRFQKPEARASMGRGWLVLRIQYSRRGWKSERDKLITWQMEASVGKIGQYSYAPVVL